MTFPILGANSAVGGYAIDNSLRFNSGDNAHLSKTPSASNRDLYTISLWAKRSNLNTGARQVLFGVGNPATTSQVGFEIRFDNSVGDGKLRINDYVAGVTDYVYLVTDAIFRDVSAWYHILYVYDSSQATNTNRTKLYVNGNQITNFSSSTYPNQNQDSAVGSNTKHLVCMLDGNAHPYNGYLAEINYIDGQALSPTDFGEFDEDSGIWKPIRYSGSYGTNGFKLNFSDSGSLGADSSGNGNNFTPTNLASTDQTTDTPTNNFATLNPLNNPAGSTFSEGNCKATTTVSTGGRVVGTVGASNGKWYCEVKAGSTNNTSIGIVPTSTFDPNALGDNSDEYGYFLSNGNKYNNSISSAYGASYTSGDIIGVALDLDAGTLIFYKNGVSQGTAFSGISGEYTFGFSDTSGSNNITAEINFGNPPFSISSGNSDDNGYGNFEYAPPSGYLALCTQNLATALSPTIDDGSQYFNTVLYTGNGGTNRSITGMGFQAYLLWHKGRNATSPNHYHSLVDSTRGTNASLASNRNDGEKAMPSFVSFDSDGFTITQDVSTDPNWNEAGNTKVVWGWKANGGTTSSNTDGSITSTVQANTTAGFSIVLYTGNATLNASIGHGLGKPPKFVIVKMREDLRDWPCLTTALDGTLDNIIFNRASSKSNVANVDLPTSSVFSMFSGFLGNGLGETYVAYCFAEIEGYSKLDSYIGNGSTDGTFVYTGFRPAFVITKATVSNLTRNWAMYDTSRDTFNVTSKRLLGNAFTAELSNSFTEIDILSNGFKARTIGEDVNYLGIGYIYMAFAENPFVTSTGIPVTAR